MGRNTELVKQLSDNKAYAYAELTDKYNLDKTYKVCQDNYGRYYISQWVKGLCVVRKHRISAYRLNQLSIKWI